MASLRVVFLKSFCCLPLYQAHNILSERGHGFGCELHKYLEKPFTFSSSITNNSLRLLLSFQTVEPSLFQVPPACLSIFLMTPRFMCALTEVPSVALPSPSGFCQSGTLTGLAVLKSGDYVKVFCTLSDAKSLLWNDCGSTCFYARL